MRYAIASPFLATIILLVVAHIAPQSAIAQDAAAPRELVKQALTHELDGKPDERNRLLAEALKVAPQDEAARWQAGQVQVKDRWLSIQQAQEQAAQDPIHVVYQRIRRTHGGTLRGEVALARWCRKHEKPEDERWHWLNVLQLQPQHEGAQRRLGLYWHRGQLMTREEIAESKRMARRQENEAKEYRETWLERIEAWREAVTSGDADERQEVLKEVQAVDDVNALAMIDHVLAALDHELAVDLVRVAAKLDEPSSSQMLIRQAVDSPSSEARELAITELKNRSQYAYVPHLMEALRMPIEFDYGIYLSPNGDIHYRHDFYEVGMMRDTSRRVRHSLRHDPYAMFSTVFHDRSGLVLGATPKNPDQIARANAEIAHERTQKVHQATAQADQLEQQVRRHNELVIARNAKIQSVLAQTTGQQHKTAADWWSWWFDYNEYAPREKPVDHQEQSLAFETGARGTLRGRNSTKYIRVGSCFAKGTPVWTQTGLKPIEEIRVGDKIYSQNPDTGELALKRVLGKTLRPPTEIIRIGIGKDEILTTRGHPFWASGHGWRMAKFLEPEMLLRTTHGSLPIELIEYAGEWPAHNLIVDDYHCYFVGQEGLLAHDNRMRTPTKAILPGFVPEE